MGYTHYWYRPLTLDADRFVSFAHDCHDLALKWEGPIGYEYDQPEMPPQFGPKSIHFNGQRDDGHETFYIPQFYDDQYPGQSPEKNGHWFSFCKTARKPYDTLVTACLIAFKHHFRRCEVHSDGSWSEWEDGRTLYTSLFPDREMPVVLPIESVIG